MKYQKLGEDIYIPQSLDSPLDASADIKFNYYLSSRINGKKIDMDITSKVFVSEKMYIRKSCYRVKMGEIEKCVKMNIIDHMKKLGIEENRIPKSLLTSREPSNFSNSVRNRIYSN